MAKTDMVFLRLKDVGCNERWEMRKQLDEFVKEHFSLLFEGAIRLGKHIEQDYYAPVRVQINNTRLHASEGLKYADNHKYNDYEAPTEEQLKNTIKDLQVLIDEASKEVKCSFRFIIEEGQ